MSNKNTGAAGTASSDDYRAHVEQIHLPLQKAILFYCAPLAMLVFIYWHWICPSWQSVVLLWGMGILVVFWLLEYRLAQQGKIILSVAFFVLPALGLAGLVMLLLDGTNGAAMWPAIAATIYAGLFSRRLLIACAAIVTLVPIFSALVLHFDMYPLYAVSTSQKIVPVLGMSLCCGPVILFFLRRNQVISETMFQSLGDSNKEQQTVIATIKGIQPEIDAAVGTIRQISARVATQSGELSATTKEINATIDTMKKTAVETSTSAAQTQAVAESTRTKSMENSEHLKTVEQGFDQVMKMVSRAASEMTSLSTQMERIAEILDFNREIGEQIKVLAVNAAIEAESAGVYGGVFGATADEFKNMTNDTDQNLARSRDLLHAIRDQSRESARTIVDGSTQLIHYREELRITGQTVDQSTASFDQTAKQVAQISESANRQQTSVSEVSTTMAELDHASVDLSNLALTLLDNINRIVSSQRDLERVLESD